MTTVNYFYIGGKDKEPETKNKILNSLSGDYNNNPIFNFDQSFIDRFNSISATTLGQQQAYIAISVLDPVSGEVIENLNISFFHKGFDSSQIRSDLRYSERPIMSLKNLSIKTDLASGYLYYTNVILSLKVHRPEALGSSFLLALLFPGMPLQLEYGWNSPDNDFLGQKDILLFAVKNYTLNMDQSGQIDLQIEGMAFNERFNNTLIGDLGEEPTLNTNSSKEEIDGLQKYKQQLQLYSSYLQDLKKTTNSSINDYSLLKTFAETYQKIENKSRGNISKAFSGKLTTLKEKTYQVAIGPKHKAVTLIKFHDLIFHLLDDTFKSLSKVMAGISELKIIYGNFNEKAGHWQNKSIADFAIDYDVLKEKLNNLIENGQYVPTIESFLNTLHQDFLENEEYFKPLLSKKKENSIDFQADIFNKPDIISHFISRKVKNSNNEEKLVMELYIIDINSGLPITTLEMRNSRTSQDETEDAVARSKNFPIIKLGHANSFIKNIKLSQLSDQYMKSVLIERMSRDRVSGPRQSMTEKDNLESSPVTPLTLPLKGSASLFGHIHWRPFRAFYLSSGLFVVDGVYKITSVEHNLSAEGFGTEIEFLWH